MQSQPLGMYAWFGYRLPLEQRLKLIAQAGFSTTCLWFGEDEELFAAKTADKMPPLARETGLSVDNIHAPFEECNGLWSDSRMAVAAALDPYFRALEYCRKHDIPILVVHVGKGSSPPPPTQTGLQALEGLVARAEKLGVVLAIENTRSPHHADFVLSGIQSDHLGLCYDSSHDFISGHSPCELLRKWGDRLLTTHLSDNNGRNDDHYLPGDGCIDWELVRDAFPGDRYSGSIMLEVVPQNFEHIPAEQFVCTAFKRASEMREKLGQQSFGGNEDRQST
ncbi:MAG: sugar phosphate isomerase/epimerase [Deltaproteobacteria bacterium]|nr:sugar phosphate isomerase/epimerase [Deltaproteobacteria bacterium]